MDPPLKARSLWGSGPALFFEVFSCLEGAAPTRNEMWHSSILVFATCHTAEICFCLRVRKFEELCVRKYAAGLFGSIHARYICRSASLELAAKALKKSKS